MTARLVHVAWLTIVWMALSGGISVSNAVGGALVDTCLVTLFRPSRPMRVVARPVAVAKFLAVFAWRLVEASAIVAWEVITPRNRINEGVVAVPVRGASDLVVTVLANVISLTPGTLTIEVDRSRRLLFVHVLHLHDVEKVRRSVWEIEHLVLRAFGAREAAPEMPSAPGARGGSS